MARLAHRVVGGRTLPVCRGLRFASFDADQFAFAGIAVFTAN